MAESLSHFRQHTLVLKWRDIERSTLSTLARFEPWRIRLIATLEPRYHPQNTSALPPLPDGNSSTRSSSLVMGYEDGSNLCLQHIFLSTLENVSRSEAHRPEPSCEPLFTLASYDGVGCFIRTCSKSSITLPANSLGKLYRDSCPFLQDSWCTRDSKTLLGHCGGPRVTGGITGDSEVKTIAQS